jgi:hypothetical protein
MSDEIPLGLTRYSDCIDDLESSKVESDLEIKQRHILRLDQIFEKNHNVAEELKNWVKTVREEPTYSVVGSKHKELLDSLSSVLAIGLEKADGVDAVEFLKFFLETYGQEGLLAHEPLFMFLDRSVSPDLIGALYYLAKSEFTGVRHDLSKRAVKLTVDIAFQGNHTWRALSTVLQEIDLAKPGYDLLAGIPDLLGKLDQYVASEDDIVFLQFSGGIERVKAVGADPYKVYVAAMGRLSPNSINQLSLPVIHRFVREATEDLKACGTITEVHASKRYSQFLNGIFNALVRPTTLGFSFWQPIIHDLAPHACKVSGVNLVLNLARLNGPDKLGLTPETVRSLVEPEALKRAMRQSVDEGDQYDLVVKLGLDGLFESSYIQKLKGAKLESALGL